MEAEVMIVETLPAYYTVLFNAVTDALEALEQQEFSRARTLLIQGQRAAEDKYLDTEESASE